MTVSLCTKHHSNSCTNSSTSQQPSQTELLHGNHPIKPWQPSQSPSNIITS